MLNNPPPTLIGLPYDASSSFLRGAAEAPPRIREAYRSPAGNFFSESLLDVEAHLRDAGDLSFPEGEEPRALIEASIARLLEEGRTLVALGGDHSITYPIVRALRRVQRPLTVLVFDAHPDLYDHFEGDRYSHACPFARIMEEGLADQLVQVGIRAMNPHQREQVDRFGVEVIATSRWASLRELPLRHPVYLSIDMDGFDPAFAPGVSHREPGGLSVREVLTAIQSIQLPIVGADIVEYNPGRDVAGLTASVCAKLVKEIVAAMLRTQSQSHP